MQKTNCGNAIKSSKCRQITLEVEIYWNWLEKDKIRKVDFQCFVKSEGSSFDYTCLVGEILLIMVSRQYTLTEEKNVRLV